MIDIKAAEVIHDILIDKFGGSKGIRDSAGLEAALARPYATFDQVNLYPLVADRATAIFESIIVNHPFIDGNKRTAYVLMRLTLALFKIEKVKLTSKASPSETCRCMNPGA